MEIDSVFFTEHSGLNPLLDQLPSYQSLLYRRKSASKRRASTGTRLGSSSGSGKWAERSLRRNEEKQTELRPIKELPRPMAEKRDERKKRLKNSEDLSGWEQWRRNTRIHVRRMKETGEMLLSSLKLWSGDIHQIEGMFGTGILSYFSFLRFLVVLNLAIFLLMFAFVMLPIILVPRASANIIFDRNDGGNCSNYPSSTRRGLVNFHEHITDLLSGEGFMERTYLFYGFYNVDKIQFSHSTYNLALAYLLTTIAYLLFSLVVIVKRSATGFKRSLIQDEDCFQSFCNKVFSGWDFCITDKNTEKLKKSSLLYELRTDLEEERIKQKMARRSRTEKLRIYFIRFILNLFVVGVLAACFYSIYVATNVSQEAERQNKKVHFIVDLINEYLPSIVMTLANFITPILFSVIINYEDYSPAFEIRFTLMRCVFMRLTSIGVLLYSLWSQIIDCEGPSCECGYNHKRYSERHGRTLMSLVCYHYQAAGLLFFFLFFHIMSPAWVCYYLALRHEGVSECWESRVGQEMYKLTIFDFIIIAAVTIFVEFPRKMLVKYCDCGLTKWWGEQEFSIPQNVLGIVYGQTICWIGTFYCPLLPAICTIKYFFIFYIKKVSLIHNCRPATRSFRASSSTFFFLGVLLIGLSLACVPVTISVAQIHCSQACGPFVNYTTSWEALPAAVSELPHGVQSFFYALSSETFAVSFFVVTCLAMFYVIALAGAHKKVISQLREQLAMEGNDKRFLIQKMTQAQKKLKQRGSRSPRSPCYHTSFASNFPAAMCLSHSPPHSSTQV